MLAKFLFIWNLYAYNELRLYAYYYQLINEEIDRYVNRLLMQVGPSILGTALNPNLNAARRPASNQDDAIDDEVITVNATTPSNLTVFEPDEEFAPQRTKRSI